MGKAQFHDRFIFILLTATAFLVSGIASTEKKYEEIKEQRGERAERAERRGNFFSESDQNYSMTIHFNNYPDESSDLIWKNKESEKVAFKLTDDHFVDGKAVVDLPFEFKLFDLNVSRVAVTKEGTIRSDDPSVNWIIAPINAKSGMTSCNISYFFIDQKVVIQWYDFQFNIKGFEEHKFKFQVRLGDKGEIDFDYRGVPYNLADVPYLCNCLEKKFGVVYTRDEFFEIAPFKETYKLGFSMDFETYNVQQGTFIIFVRADRCMEQTNCLDCTNTKFRHDPKYYLSRCSWCPAIKKCSSMRDSLRHVWKEHCDFHHMSAPSLCNEKTEGLNTFMLLMILSVSLTVTVLCVLLKESVVKVCITIPLEWLRERIQSINQPNQPVDNIQAEDQSNDQEEQQRQQEPVVWDYDLFQKPATYV